MTTLDQLVADHTILIQKIIAEAKNEPDWYNESFNDSHTWTKYVLKTENTSLEFWYLGESNGYYCESVSIKKI